MKRAGILVLAGALVATLVAASDPMRERDADFRSQAISGTLHYVVYLPPGYGTSGMRYPVVYFLHGLPSSGTAYRSVGFVEQALDGLKRPAILVAPQGARWNEPDPEYVDHGPGDRWETAIARELPRVVDARYRTIRSRDGRALGGESTRARGSRSRWPTSHPRSNRPLRSGCGYRVEEDRARSPRLSRRRRAARRRGESDPRHGAAVGARANRPPGRRMVRAG